MKNLHFYYDTQESIEDFYAPIFAVSKWLDESVLNSDSENIDSAFHNIMCVYAQRFTNREDFNSFMEQNATFLDEEIRDEYQQLIGTKCEQCSINFVPEHDNQRFCCKHCEQMAILDYQDGLEVYNEG